jgi:multiple sugar transport system ATP-binding protein
MWQIHDPPHDRRLEDITSGELYIDGKLMNKVHPRDRDIAMVFQNYALYPYMSVFDNMAFGLKLRKVPKGEIRQKVEAAADILGLKQYLDAKPSELSGGQRQRVALGRAIVREPKVFLLDEPLSNLDAKMRATMRTEIIRIHQRLQTTFVYVTHDQTEAMTMGQRIVVMKDGRIQQVDTPDNLYLYPVNKFVAGFIGTPQMNFFTVTLKREGENVAIKFDGCEDSLNVSFNSLLKVRPKYLNGIDKVTMGVRCEHFSLDPELVKGAVNKVKVKISHFEELGAETLIYGDLNMNGDGYTETGTRVIIKSYKGTLGLQPGQIVEAAVDMDKVHFFDLKTEKTIVPRVPEVNVFDCDVKAGKVTFLGTTVALPSAMSCPDLAKAELFVPIDALRLGGKDLEATVTDYEEINGNKIAYLEKGGRVFFLKVTEELAKGSKIGLGLDYKRLTIEKDGQEFIAPFPEFDSFLGAFTNLENQKISLKALVKYLEKQEEEEERKLRAQEMDELSAVSFQPILYKKYEEAYKAQVVALKKERSFRIGTEEVGSEGKKRIHNETAQAILEAKKAYEAKIQELDDKKAQEATLSDEEKAALAEKQGAITSHYEEEIALLRERISNRIALIKQGASSMESLRAEEKASLAEAQGLLNQEETENKAARADLSASYDQRLAEAKAKAAAAQGDEKDHLTMIYHSLQTEKKNALKTLLAQENLAQDEMLFAHRRFYAYVDGVGIVSSLSINKKVVKSLGLDLFTSQFRYEIPHDAYKLCGDNEGLAANVLETLDYGDALYAHLESNGTEFYAKVDHALEKGAVVHVLFDLEGGHVVENRFDIRLS